MPERDRMIAELALAFGTRPGIWRRMDQASLDIAWLTAHQHWGQTMPLQEPDPRPAGYPYPTPRP